MSLRYSLGAIVSLPLLPIIYFQGKRIRKSVPQLPEAKGISGTYKIDNSSEKSLKIISIGESTIAGVGVQTHEEGFTGSYAKNLAHLIQMNIDWRVYARSGYTAKRVQYKIIPKIQENHADLIVVGLGGNDAFTLNRPSKWKAEVESLIKAIQKKFPVALIVFCNMPPIKEFPAFTSAIKFTVGNLVEILGEELENLTHEMDGVYYFGESITLEQWVSKFNLKANKKDFFSDGVHPSLLTYQTWAKDVANKTFNHKEIKDRLFEKNI